MRILLADSDSVSTTAIRNALRSDSLVVEIVSSAAALVERASAVPYSAIVVDLALEGARGPDTVSLLRKNHVAAPILALAPDASPDFRVKVLEAGADDCLAKPVLLGELTARVHALTRRAGRRAGVCLELEDLVLHCGPRRAFRAGRAIPLTEREFTALEFLANAHGRSVSASELLSLLWTEEGEPQGNFIAVLMMRLRKKVDGDCAVRLIHTERGKGYQLRPSGDGSRAADLAAATVPA